MTRNLLFFAFSALLAITVPFGRVEAIPSNERSYVFTEAATALFNEGDYRAAIIQLKNAIQQDARNPAARVLLGRSYLHLGDGELAERELLQARRFGAHPKLVLIPLGRAFLLQRKYGEIFAQIRPGHQGNRIEAAVQDIRGRAYLALRNYTEAEKAFTAASQYQPRLAYPLLGLARIKSSLGKSEEAERLVDKALLLEPRNSDVWYEKADLLRARQDYSTALQSYDKAIEYQPKNIPARLGRATVLVQLKRDEEALADLEYVRHAAPRETRASYLHAQVLTRAGAKNEALTILAEAEQVLKRRAPEFVQNHLPSLLLLGVIGYARGNYEDSFKYLSRYLELEPTHPGARKLLGSILLKKGDIWGAIATLKPALDYAPRDTGILTLLGNAHMRVQQFADASAYLEKAVELEPENAALRTQLGISRLGTGETEKAEDNFETAIESKADGSRPDLLLGLLHLKQGNYEKALRVARTVAEKDPTNPFSFNLAGAAELGKGNLKAARKQYEAALQLRPNYTPALFNLAKLDMAEGRVDEAKARFTVILEKQSKNVKAMDGLANVALSERNLDDAIKWLQQIIILRPNSVRHKTKIISIFLQQRRVDSALGAAESLELMHPSDTLALETYGRVLVVAQRFTAAAAKYRRLAELASDSPERLGRIAQLQEEARDIAGARDTLNRAIALKPKSTALKVALIGLEARENNSSIALELARDLRNTNPDNEMVDLMIGDLLMSERRYHEAAKAYSVAMERSENSEIVRRLFEAKRLSGRKAEALQLLSAWIGGHPDDMLAQRLMASAYRHYGRIAEAIAANERLLEKLPDDPAILNNLAGLYQKKGDRRALSYAEKSFRLRPQHAATLDTYGWLLVLNGEPERGLELIRQAFTRAADNPEIRYHLAVALNRTGREKEALVELERALESGIEFDGISTARALLQKLVDEQVR